MLQDHYGCALTELTWSPLPAPAQEDTSAPARTVESRTTASKKDRLRAYVVKKTRGQL
jgi:hypothetical protein